MGTLIQKFRLILTGAIILAFAGEGNSQNNVGIGTTTPDASAVLDVTSTSKGMLVPRMTTAQRTAIAAPTNGLLVYDTNFDCFFYWIQATTPWQSMCANSGPAGPAGANGTNGINCWDTNPSNCLPDPAEDINNDGFWNALDCAGTPGATGATGTAGVAGTTGATGDT